MKEFEVTVRELQNGVRHICLFADNKTEAENRVRKAYKNTFETEYNDIVNIIDVVDFKFSIGNPKWRIAQIKRIVNSVKGISKVKVKIIKNENIEFYRNFDGTVCISFIPYNEEWTAKRIKNSMDKLYFLYENDVILETEIGLIALDCNIAITATGFNFDGLYETNISLFGKDGTVYSNY